MLLSRTLPALLILAVTPPALADERRVMATSFDAVRVDGPFDVAVTAGGSTGAVVTGDRQAIEAVSVRVEDRTLIVQSNANDWGGWPDGRQGSPRITATVPFLRSAVLAGNGRLTIDRMQGQEVSVSVTGSGSVTIADVAADQLLAVVTGATTLAIAGKVGRARFATNGANRVDASGLAVRDLTILSEGSGDSQFLASDTASVVANGLGSVIVAGGPACTVSGAGPIRCGE